MTRPDLHLHSTFSDGVMVPELLLHEAVQAGVTVMAVTDHDTFAGSDALLGTDTPIPVIPGVELSISDMHGLHLLGYGYARGEELRRTVEALAQKRVERARRMLERLAEMGMPLDWRVLERKYRGTVGRPHIARAMVHARYVSRMQEAFDKYLGHGRPAYVPSERLGMAEALELLRRNGFVPVLAHPWELGLNAEQLVPLIDKWQAQGLLGLEVYHPSAESHGWHTLENIARRRGLLVTGGSDFHQENDRHGRIGATAPFWARAEEDMEALRDALERGRQADRREQV